VCNVKQYEEEALTIQPRPLLGTIFKRYVKKYIVTTRNDSSDMKCWILAHIILIQISLSCELTFRPWRDAPDTTLCMKRGRLHIKYVLKLIRIITFVP
jgi:hypothetical protein